MNSEIQDCYRALELEPGASLEQVKQAWRELVKVWHPDRFPNDPNLQLKAQDRLKEINSAYESLQEFLASGTPPPKPRPPPPQSTDANAGQNHQRSRTGKERTEEPPPRPSEQRASAPTKSRAGYVWAVIVGAIILWVVLANTGLDSNRAISPDSGGYGSQSAGNGSGFKPPPAYVPQVSKALDERNGFKDFKFGMTPDEARAIMPPSEVADRPGANVTNFHYRATAVNRIGDFSIDYLGLNFFGGHLYRIDLRFSNFQNEILEAFKVNFGDPIDTDLWKRDDQPLRGKAWQGRNVYAAILSMPGQLWDSAVIYDVKSNDSAQDYAAREPERAAADFATNGFKSLVMGMRSVDVTLGFNVSEEPQDPGITKIVFRREGNWKNWQTIGFYPVTSISAAFFHDRLYRLDLAFEENRKEIFETFKKRFEPLQANDTWTRGVVKLKAMSCGNDKLFAVILAPQATDESGDAWDTIVLLDAALWKEAEQFKQDAPKRAAKDF
jgi:hypothetical protein